MIVDGRGYVIYDNDNREIKYSRISDGEAVDTAGPGFDLDRDHLTNFIECIHEGRRPVSDIRDANVSVHICHLGNIAHRTGRVINCNTHDGRIMGDTEAMNNLWRREYEPEWEPVV